MTTESTTDSEIVISRYINTLDSSDDLSFMVGKPVGDFYFTQALNATNPPQEFWQNKGLKLCDVSPFGIVATIIVIVVGGC